MGAAPWRPPLPKTATREEMEADLAALRAEIRRNNAFLAIVFCSVPVIAIALGAMFWAAS